MHNRRGHHPHDTDAPSNKLEGCPADAHDVVPLLEVMRMLCCMSLLHLMHLRRQMLMCSHSWETSALREHQVDILMLERLSLLLRQLRSGDLWARAYWSRACLKGRECASQHRRCSSDSKGLHLTILSFNISNQDLQRKGEK
jgi:hypothetical protein